LRSEEIYTRAHLIPSSSLPHSGSSQRSEVFIKNGQSVTKYWYRQKLTKSNTNNEVWFFLDPSGSDAGVGAQLIDANQQTSFISPKYSTSALANATTEDATPGYLALVYKSTSADSSSLDGDDIVSTNDYQFDYKTGVLQFRSSTVDPTDSQYLYMTAYQYVGQNLRTGLEIEGPFTASDVSFTGESDITSFASTAQSMISGSWRGWASQSAEKIFGGSVRVTGDIIAENYIVSSSVTYLTQSFSSGSSIFGDTGDDTHKFTGSLYVNSGSDNTFVISSSGNIGINTFTPGTKLEVIGNVSSSATGSFQHLFVGDRITLNDNQDSGEYIEGDGTDININVGSSGDINIPASIGLTFGNDGEKIEGDGTDLTIASSNDLNLTATTDINIPANVGLTFGDDAEKIEGDGTNLTISANKILLDSAVTSGSSVSTGSFGRLELAGNLSAPSTGTGSFGLIESTTHIATTVESATFACFGLISGSSISTGSFGRVVVDYGNTQAFIIDNAKISGSSITTGSFGRLELAGNANIAGNITLGGSINIGDAAGDDIVLGGEIKSNIIPDADATYDLGSSSKGWNDLHLGSGGVINLDGGDVTLTHSSNLVTITGGSTRVDKLEIDGANDHIDVSTDMVLTAAADITLTPGGANVKPGSDSAIDLGVSGTAFRELFVDAIDLNGQGSISVGGTGRIDLDGDDDTSIRASADDIITFEAGAVDIAQMTTTMAVSGSSISTGSFGRVSTTTIDLASIQGNWTNAGNTVADLGTVTTADINGGTIDGITSLTAGGDLDIGAHGFRAATITADGLTATRVPFAGTAGLLSDDSDLTFATATLSATNLTTTGTIKNMALVSGSSVSTGSFGRLELAGNANISGNITLGGNINIGDAGTDDIVLGGEIKSNIIPDADNTYDLGSSAKQWKDIYVNGIGYIDSLGTDADPVTAYINAGELDNVIIGGEGTTSANFTTVNTSGNISGSSTTTGSFGRVQTAGDINSSGRVFENDVSVIDHATAMSIVFGG
jgi:hypothetical protein